MALFLSTFVNKVDKKGRISVPATFRAALAAQSFQGIVCYRGFTADALEGCGRDVMEALAATVDPLDPFSGQDNPKSLILGDARELAWDGEGRVVLPEEFIEFAHIGETAAFYGMGRKFQIWNPERLKTFTEELRRQTMRDRLAPGGEGGA